MSPRTSLEMAAAMQLDLGPGQVRREAQAGRRAVELVPSRSAGSRGRALQVVALPGSEVGVLDRKRGQVHGRGRRGARRTTPPARD